MTAGLHLTISTPSSVLVELPDAISVRAEDASGGFGILPGHADFLTVLSASVVRWRDGAGEAHYCAQGGGIFTVTGGNRVLVACCQGTLGDDLSTLEAQVQAMRAAGIDADRAARVAQTRLHANAVRQLMRLLRDGSGADALIQPGEGLS